jgi:predicted thioesterase
MNLQTVRELVIEQWVSLPVRPHANTVPDAKYNQRFTSVFNTSYLRATIEGLCVDELAKHATPFEETVIGTGVDFRQSAVAHHETAIYVRGYVVDLSASIVTFYFVAMQDDTLIGAGTYNFAVMSRATTVAEIRRESELPGTPRTPPQPPRFDVERRLQSRDGTDALRRTQLGLSN